MPLHITNESLSKDRLAASDGGTTLKKKRGFFAVAAFIMFACSGAEAADLASAVQQVDPIDERIEEGWQFEVGIYGFLPDIQTKTTTGDELDLPLWKILQNLNSTAQGILKIRNGRFHAYTDNIYMNLQGTKTSTARILGSNIETGVGVHMETFINTTGVGYEVIANDRTRIEAVAGMRYLWLSTDISANIGGLNSEIKDQDHVFDGIVGLAGRTQFTDKFYANYYGDIGAGQSDLTWQVYGGLNYSFKHFDTVIGYRFMRWQLDDVASLSQLTAHGPQVGVKFKF